ncbi:MAG: hypothetical protein RBT02_08170 [Bacteroidales bacterium]|jgi:hypothetical protein|nr:hypothetical protein [Bacteroidales bacterium]
MRHYKLTLIIVIFSFSWNLFAQEKLFYQRNLPDYTEYLSNEYGIICRIPERLTNLDKYYVMWKVREAKDKHTGGLYGPIFQSKDKGCLLMYAALPHYISKEDIEIFKKTAMIERILNKDTSTSESLVSPKRTFPRSRISAEIETALGLYYRHGHPSNNDSVKIDLNEYVTIISGKKAHEMFNADTIYIYDIPSADSVYFLDSSLEKIRKKKYPYCTGVFISKDGRATMYFKFFFTERSRKKEEKYINMLDKQVWYDEIFRHE